MRQAVALGLLHGPAELIPVSSSGHTTLLAWWRRWGYDTLEPSTRKRFEVALHAGTTAALLVLDRRELRETLIRRRGEASPVVVVLACVPAALAGTLLGEQIERHLGTPKTIAAALTAGAAAMAVAERRGSRGRLRADAGLLDAAALGAAQAVALIPGVSRSGATRAAARARGFAPAEAAALANAVGLPVTLGALALKGGEALRGERTQWGPLGAGAFASFASTLAAGAAITRRRRDGSLLPFAAYRVAVAAAVVRRLRQNAAR